MGQNEPNMAPKWPGIDLKNILKNHRKLIFWAGEPPTKPQMVRK
jgi:hypothetical protein